MAREIIIVDVKNNPADGSFEIAAALWLVAPANKVVPQPSVSSAVPPSSSVSWGVTTAELAALQAGTVVEQVIRSGQLPSATTGAQVKTALQNAYAAAQTALNNQAPAAKWIGASWDGTNWTAAP
jgi:hypothetical protein